MEDHQRIARIGMLIKARGQQHMRADVDIPSPELRQKRAADADMSDKLGVRLARDRRDHLIEGQGEALRMRRIDVQLDGLGIDIAGLGRPLLTLALVRRELQRSSVGEVKGLVTVQHRLNEVVALRQLRQRPRRPAERLVIDHRLSPGGETVDGRTEQIGRIEGGVRGHVALRLAGQVLADQKDDPAVEGRAGLRLGNRDREDRTCGGVRLRRGAGKCQKRGQNRNHGRAFSKRHHIPPRPCRTL